MHLPTLLRQTVLIASCACFLFSPRSRAADAAPRPNILLIVADDLGWGDVGYHGAPIRTPTLDALARTGVELDQHYVYPVCTPTRVALMTGRYPSRYGPQALVPSNRRAVPEGTETLASALRGAGYRTAMAGKWHLGSRPEWGPNRFGFDHAYGSLTGATDPVTHQYRPGPYAKTWHRDGKLLDETGNVTELLAEQVVRWIREMAPAAKAPAGAAAADAAAPRPWFIYVPFTAVHIPVDAPERYKQAYANQRFDDDPARDESFRRYAAFTSQLDEKIGQLVEALDQTGQRRETLIVFTSDNGAIPSGRNEYISTIAPTPRLGSNAPLRGQKATLYEGGIRVPAFANWPGLLEPRKVTAPMHAVDWFPTLTRLAGCGPRAADAPPLDGRDAWPQIAAGAPAEPRTMYWVYSGSKALRHGDWKLVVPAARKGDAATAGAPQLFDLARDPGEQNDLAAVEGGRVGELRALLDDVAKGDQTTLPDDLREVPN